MGLSLTADEVVWVLVDEHEQRLLDHDALAVPDPGHDAAVAAARSAQVIATADGVGIDAVRVTGCDGDTNEVVIRLRALGFRRVDVVRPDEAREVVETFAPRLRAAAGAALRGPDPCDRPAQVPLVAARRRRGVVAALMGTAAAAVLSVLFMTTGSVPQSAHATATAPAETAPAVVESGWMSVPAPPPAGAQATRKFVTSPAPRASAPVYYSAPAVVASAPAPAVAEAHLDSPVPLAGPLPDDSSQTSAVVMADLSNMFAALP